MSAPGLSQPRDRGLIPSASGLELLRQENWSGAPTAAQLTGDTNSFGELVIPVEPGDEIEWLALGYNIRSTGVFNPTFIGMRLASGDGTGVPLEWFPVSIGGGSSGAAINANTDVPISAIPPPGRMKWNSFDQLKALFQNVQAGVNQGRPNWRLQAFISFQVLGANQTFTFTIRSRFQRYKVSS